MGVKDLWPILSPICEKKSLWELENQSIAVDLSAWICDSQNVSTSQSNMYLRNLFFRTNYLLLLGVKPVFVLEGNAPEVKEATMRKRMGKEKSNCSRSRLKGMQTQCVQLLSSMGVSCVRGRGEAEAYCAHLNELGIVSGVVTQDSDAFLYGAKEVYRHFQMGPSYTCDCYKMETVVNKLGLSRNKLIGFSLLCGSDYNQGVSKVGKQSAMKFLTSIPDDSVIQKFKTWKSSTFDLLKNQKNISSEFKHEISIREKAILDPDFPHLDVIAEYTAPPQEVDYVWNWEKPDLNKFINIALNKLSWDEEYALKKFLPLLGRWQLLNPHIETPISILNILNWRKKDEPTSSFKVEWVIRDYENIENVQTWELESNVSQAYPALVEAYKDSKIKKRTKKVEPKVPKTKVAKTVPKTKVAKTNVANKENKVKTIEKFLVKRRRSLRKSLPPPDNPIENDELNLSDILSGIVSREISNPALLRNRRNALL